MSSLPSINAKVQESFTRKQLLKNGYLPLPLAGKKCHLRDWPSISITDQSIAQWGEGNTGIRCDNLLVLDIDISDDNAAAVVSGAIQKRFGQTIVRRGRKGCALFFRCGATIAKVKIEGTSEGTKACVELLGDAGHYIAAFGNHPDTGQPYRYDDARFGGTGQSPLDVPTSDLPEISEGQIPDLVALIRATLAGCGYSPERAAASPRAQGGYTSRQDATAAAVRACRRVEAAQEGERNTTLVKAAFDLGGHVGAGTLDRKEAEERLLETAIGAGLPEKEAADTIASGLRGGVKRPYSRKAPAAPSVYTSAELMAEDLLPMSWVFPDILPEGLTVLAGKPKMGKSWLALQICLSVAHGADHVGLGVNGGVKSGHSAAQESASSGQIFCPGIASLFGLGGSLLRPDLRSPQPSRAAAVKEARRAPRSGAQRPGRPRARRHAGRRRTRWQLSGQTTVTPQPPATETAVVCRLGADLAAIAVRF